MREILEIGMEKEVTFEELISLDYAYSCNPRVTAWVITANVVIFMSLLLLITV